MIKWQGRVALLVLLCFLVETAAPIAVTRAGNYSRQFLAQADSSDLNGIALQILPIDLSNAYLDAEHSYKDYSFDSPSVSAYLLRNVYVQDLLSTRIAIAVLIGGRERAAAVARNLDCNEFISFAAPEPTSKLYRHLPEGPLAEFAYKDVRDRLDWLENQNPKPDAALRTELAGQLAHLSAVLVRIDVTLKYLEKDFWSSREVKKEFFDRFVKPNLKPTSPQDAPAALYRAIQTAKQTWLTANGTTEKIENLKNWRAAILDQYRLLALTQNKVTLYQKIYFDISRGSLGFPIAPNQMNQDVQGLPAGNNPIPVPRYFDVAVEAGMLQLKKSDRDGVADKVAALINGQIDRALLKSLDENTKALETITEEQHYFGSKSSGFTSLASTEELWPRVREQYGYFTPVLDFEQNQAILKDNFERVQYGQKILVYGGYSIATLGLALSFGTFAPLEALLTPLAKAAGMVGTGAAALQYVHSRSAANINREMFRGTAHTGNYRAAEDAMAIESRDYNLMLFSALLLGADITMLSGLARSRVIVQNASRSFVMMRESELAPLQSQVSRWATRTSELIIPAQLWLSRITTALREETMPLEFAVKRAASSLKMSSQQVMTVLESNPLIGRVVRLYKSRIASSPENIRLFVREQVASVAFTVGPELQERGSNIGKEWPHLLLDTASTSVMTAALVVVMAGPTPQILNRLKFLNAPVRRPPNVFAQSIPGVLPFTTSERLSLLTERAAVNGTIGFISNGLLNTAFTGIKLIKGDTEINPREELTTNLKYAAFGAAYLSLSSTTRYELLKHVNDSVEAAMHNSPGSAIILNAVSARNQYFAGWHYVKLLKLTGVEPTIEDRSTLVAESLGTAAIRLDYPEEVENPAAHLFDFLGDNTQSSE